MIKRYWKCLIGPVDQEVLDNCKVNGADFPPRFAARNAVMEMLEVDPPCRSGWISEQEAMDTNDATYNKHQLETLVSLLVDEKISNLPESLSQFIDEKYTTTENIYKAIKRAREQRAAEKAL